MDKLQVSRLRLTLKTRGNVGLELDTLTVPTLYLSLSLSVLLCLSVSLYVLTQFPNSCFKKRMWKTCDLSFFVALIICWKQPTNWRRHFFFFSLFFLGCPLVSLPYNIYLLPSTPHKNTIWPPDFSERGFSPLTWRLRRLSKSRSSNSKSPASNAWTLWCPSSPHSSWSVALR